MLLDGFSGFPKLSHVLNLRFQDYTVPGSIYKALQEVVKFKKDAKISLLQTSMDKAVMELNKSWRLDEAPAPFMRLELDKSELVEFVVDCMEGYVSVRKEGVRTGIIAEGSPNWEWAIGRFGVLAWTWLINDKRH